MLVLFISPVHIIFLRRTTLPYHFANVSKILTRKKKHIFRNSLQFPKTLGQAFGRLRHQRHVLPRKNRVVRLHMIQACLVA